MGGSQSRDSNQGIGEEGTRIGATDPSYNDSHDSTSRSRWSTPPPIRRPIRRKRSQSLICDVVLESPSQWVMDDVQHCTIMVTGNHLPYLDQQLVRRTVSRTRFLSEGHERDEQPRDALSYPTEYRFQGPTNEPDSFRKPIKSQLAGSSEHLGELSQLNGSRKDGSGKLTRRDSSAMPAETNPVWMSIVYALINAVIVLPVMMSFGNIIYHDAAFRPYLPVLVKLTVVSSIVHQLVFSTFSSLPFAVGQVQDAGLIFLSSMASQIVVYCKEHNYDDSHMLATATVGLGLCTAILGFGLVAMGRFRLAQHVRRLAIPVVGAYLAYIGWFCGQSGLALMAGVTVSGPAEWFKFCNWDALVHMLPGMIGGVLIYVLARTLRHMAVLPTCIALLLFLFYTVLFLTHKSVAEAAEHGWVSQAEPAPVWYKTWDYLRFDHVVWSAFPPLSLTLISMILVVALSSSLDVAAIELELKRPLDYDHELWTVGLSNVVSGLLGGYTGSYIFSQSIFSLRAGIRSRWMGYILAFCEMLFVVIPVSLLSYVPNFFFGSLLVMICIDLMYEWLWDVRLKLTRPQYGVTLATFCFMQCLGVEYGIFTGILVHYICSKLGLDMGQPKDRHHDSNTNQSGDDHHHYDRKLHQHSNHETSSLIIPPSLGEKLSIGSTDYDHYYDYGGVEDESIPFQQSITNVPIQSIVV
mmetsp:Transcript_20380/g.36903  ORF Transcript_20380/g.36903 Transcript_20380/m.36903 type:complete len:692 (-) Transcript_20380:164-2239(-)